MHEVCIGHLKNPTPGACGWLEPGPRPDGNQPRIAPHGRVTPRVSQPLCAAAGEEVALQIAQGDDRMWLLRAPPPLFTRAGTQSGSGVRQAAPGDVVRSKAFPRRGLPVRRQRPACHRVCAVPRRPCGDSFPRLGCGKAA